MNQKISNAIVTNQSSTKIEDALDRTKDENNLIFLEALTEDMLDAPIKGDNVESSILFQGIENKNEKQFQCYYCKKNFTVVSNINIPHNLHVCKHSCAPRRSSCFEKHYRVCLLRCCTQFFFMFLV